MTDAVVERDSMLEGITMTGDINTPMETILANVRHAIRQGHPQARTEPVQSDRVALVGSGPSLNETEAELRQLVFEGAKVVTLNGAYHWCIARNIRPSAQVVLDAKPSTARFLLPAVPQCLYYVASQCHPETWLAVRERRTVIFHACSDGPEATELDAYYGKDTWLPVIGGTTVASRAIGLLRHAGYVRFDLFGIDCCWLNGEHHALPQPENASDKSYTLSVVPKHGGGTATFNCAPWHLQQFDDFLKVIRLNGSHFLLNVHGSGLLATALRMGAADVSLNPEQECAS